MSVICVVVGAGLGLSVLIPSVDRAGKAGADHGSLARSAPTPTHSRSQSSVPPATVPPSTAAPTTLAPGPPYQVQDETITLVDHSRDTPARGSVPASQGRILVTVVRRPVGAPGPMPLVVFAHGWNSDPAVYEVLLDTWAAAGYLVAAPTFSDSADTLPGTPVSNFAQQALDMSFVISSLLGGEAGAVDPNRIAVAGHSDGGSDVDVLALDPVYADHRIRAYLSMSGDIDVGLPGPWGAATPGAFEASVGTNDQYGEQPLTTRAFDTANLPKVLLTVAGGDHLGMYVGSSALSVALRQETLRFLAAALGSGTPSSGQLASIAMPTGDPAIEVTPG